MDLARRQGTILLSLPVLSELFEVLNRNRFRRYIEEAEIRRFLAALTREAQWVDVDVNVAACRDPKDDKFRSLAVNGRASYIVTGDVDLLELNPFQGNSSCYTARFSRSGDGAAIKGTRFPRASSGSGELHSRHGADSR